MAEQPEYSSEYHRLVVTGLVDHQWAAELQNAAKGVSEHSVASVLQQRGFTSNADLEKALAELNWEAILNVAKAFGEIHPSLIC
jgi:hypothetical protein